MALYRALAILPAADGQPDHGASNTWWFVGPDDANDETLEDIGDIVNAFYVADPAGGAVNTVSAYLAKTLAGDVETRVYDMRDPTPRVPRATATAAYIPASAMTMPGEVCAILRYEGARVSGQLQRRRRGHMKIGPLNINADVEEAGAGWNRPDNGFRTVLLDAAQALAGALFPGWDWVVHSETGGGNTTVRSVGVPNEWGTLRKRGATITDVLTRPIDQA